MKTLLLTLGLAIIIGVGAFWLRATPQHTQTSGTASRVATKPLALLSPAAVNPTVGSPSETPSTIVANTPTTVTVTVVITPAPILNGVNLLRLGATGTQPTILGVMHDDGKNGDTVAGDGIYTLQVSFNEPNPCQVQLQVSAAFSGRLTRTLSSITYLPVWGTIQDPIEGFSTKYPPGLYASVSPDVPSQHLIESSPLDVDLGGAAPDSSSQTASSGFAIAINSIPYTNTFTITQYLSDIHPDDPLDTITPVTVAGTQGYMVVFKEEIGAGEPITIIPRNGSVLEVSYSSTFGLNSIQDQNGLSAYNSVLSTMTLY